MIKTLMKEIKEYKKSSLLAPAFVIFEVIMEISIPFAMAKLIDNGVSKGDMGYIVRMGSIMAVMTILALLFGFLAGKEAAKASTGFAKNVRKSMFENIQTFSFSNIDKYSTAGLITRLTTDVTNVQNSYQMIVRMCARSPIMFIGAMVMTFYISPQISLIFFGVIIFLSLALYLIIKRAFPTFSQVFKKYDNLNASVQENISAIRVVKAYVREEQEISKFNKACEELFEMFLKAEKLVILNAPLMQLCMYACILLISWIGAKMIVSTTLTTGELMSLFSYVTNILISLMMISMVFVMITMSKASADRITEVINEKSNLNNPENPLTDINDGSIEFKNVSFRYNEGSGGDVLKNINLKINSGETIGIIGGTGSAKTTLVQLIPRLYDVASGEVLVGGIDVRKYDIETLRNDVAMVLQKNVLFSGTINENVKWGNKDASDEDVVKVCKLACADEFIQLMPDKYETYIEQGGTNVSGGQKQRLCIARALLKNPKILILDDSTSAVDTKTDASIRKAFMEDIPNTTKIIIAQRITSIQDADRILVLEDGKIDGFGTHEELIKSNEIYNDIYESQKKGVDKDE